MRFVRALAASLVLALACAQASAPDGDRAVRPASAAVAAAPPVTYVELLVGGARAGDRLPMIVAVHGRGATPESFGVFFRSFPMPARVILPRAPEPLGEGFTWFAVRAADGETRALAAGVARAADRVAATLDLAVERFPTAGKPVVLGFSQGGMISYAVAVRHPTRIAAALPIGGFLPDPLVPDGRRALPPIVGFHGQADEVVALELDVAGVERLRAFGNDVTLHVFPGVGHTIPPAVWIPCEDAIGRYLAVEAAKPAP